MSRNSKLTLAQAGDETVDQSALQKSADFVRAFMLGFDVDVRGVAY